MRTASEESLLDEHPARVPAPLLFIVGKIDQGDVTALQVLGFDPLLSHDGAEVLAALAAGLRPDITVLDMRVPEEMDRAVLATLQSDELASVPVVVLSDLEEPREEPDANFYVVRTIDPVHIRAIARQAHLALRESPSEDAAHEDDAPPSGALKRARVLVIDDDAYHRDTLAETLLNAGYNVETAIHGRDALAKTIGFRPELIILDLMMPVLDGWGFMDELHRTPALASIPVVVLSSGSHALLAAAPRAVGYLRKPLDVAELLRAVRVSLDNTRSRPARDPTPRR